MQASEAERRCPMADSESGYKVGPGRPPLHTRFQKGQSGNPDGRSTKSLPALLADALSETGGVTIDGPRRLAAADKEVVQQFVARLRRQILQEIEEATAAAPPGDANPSGRVSGTS